MFDPYSTLGISKSASQDEIKKAYRQLAKKLHPDLNPGNKEAEKKFKDVSHAFDLIGSAEARGKFDRGETFEQPGASGEDYFKQRRGPFYSQTQSGPQGGRYTYNFQDEFGDEDLFDAIFGRRGARGGAKRGGFPGEDQLFQIEVDFTEAALGAEKLITLPNGKKLQVKIPAGIEEGKRLRFRGQGAPGSGNAPAGDMYLEIKIRPKDGYRRSGLDIETEVPISLFEAVLGGEIPVITLDGTVMLKVPKGSSSGTKLRVKGRGAGDVSNRGHFIVELKILVPKNPSQKFIDGLELLSKEASYNPREGT